MGNQGARALGLEQDRMARAIFFIPTIVRLIVIGSIHVGFGPVSALDVALDVIAETVSGSAPNIPEVMMPGQPETQPRICVVEDEAIIAEEIRERLTHLGFTVVGVVASGAEAIQVAERTPLDLVLMDIHLQGPMDG